jgi:tetratricopeptide (TPR) repeat protein
MRKHRIFGILLAMAAVTAMTRPHPAAADRAQAMQIMRDADAAIQANPNDEVAYVRRGYAHLEMMPPGAVNRAPGSELSLAIRDFDAALRLNPNDFVALHNRAHAAYLAGQPQAAIQEFTRALALNPQSAQSYMGRGWAFLQIGQDARARSDFEQTLRIDPSLRPQLVANAQDIQRARAQRQQAMAQRNPQADAAAQAMALSMMQHMFSGGGMGMFGFGGGGGGGGGGSSQPSCQYSSYAACQAARNGDTWAADRIENGTSSGSEHDWYDR